MKNSNPTSRKLRRASKSKKKLVKTKKAEPKKNRLGLKFWRKKKPEWLKIRKLKKEDTKKKFKLSRLKNKKTLAGVILLALMIAFCVWIFWDIPLPSKLSQTPAVSTKIFDRNGKLIYEIYADQRRTPVDLDQIPQYVIDATIAIEDKDFYKHHGFDVTGMLRGAYKTVFEKKLEGGSTLTQQLVKNSLLTPERTIRRKLREFVLSVMVEMFYSKQRILEMYLNQIPYGSTAYGIGSASELYFGKEVQDLTLGEAAMLAGLPQAPTRYSPFGAHPDYAHERQKTVLHQMVADGYITQEQADEAAKQELKYAESEQLKAPHFALWVKEQLAEKYGDRVTEQGGLRVITTLDLDLQDYAQEVVADEVDKLSKQGVGNGAALVTKPGTGEILAMVGSKDYNADDEDGKVNIIFAKRQPGSSIKPLNYALAISNEKITASTPLADVPTCFLVAGQQPYCPSNYDGQFHGATQARFALGNSYNIPAVRVLALNGLNNFIDFATKAGITTFSDPDNYGLSLTLGGGEVMPYDMARAFGVFANGGVRKDLISILKISDWKGKVYKEVDLDNVEGTRVLDQDTSYIISHILYDNNARAAAFGTGSYLVVRGHPEVSVKTGTTNDLRDNWTIGYDSDALVLTWVGNNDNSPMHGAVSGVSGASPIWNRIMREVLDKAEEGYYDNGVKHEHAWPLKPQGVVGANVCATTGALPNDATNGCPMRFEYFIDGTVPADNAYRGDIAIDRNTQSPAGADTPPEQIEMQNHLIMQDPLGTTICFDCAGAIEPVNVSYNSDN
jgi:penicillin-binding protein 1C